MKKVKLILLSFCVLAGAAGALAFKAKVGLEICYAAVNTSSPFCGTSLSPKTCPSYVANAKSSPTNHLCIAPTTGIVGSECTGVNCSTISVASTTIE